MTGLKDSPDKGTGGLWKSRKKTGSIKLQTFGSNDGDFYHLCHLSLAHVMKLILLPYAYDSVPRQVLWKVLEKCGCKLVGDHTVTARLSEVTVTETQFADDAALYNITKQL